MQAQHLRQEALLLSLHQCSLLAAWPQPGISAALRTRPPPGLNIQSDIGGRVVGHHHLQAHTQGHYPESGCGGSCALQADAWMLHL
jgi:hypothetical protein